MGRYGRGRKAADVARQHVQKVLRRLFFLEDLTGVEAVETLGSESSELQSSARDEEGVPQQFRTLHQLRGGQGFGPDKQGDRPPQAEEGCVAKVPHR